MKDKTLLKLRNQVRSSYLTTTISISLVLFLLGLIGLLVLNAKRLSDYVRENIGFSVILKENVKELDIYRIQKNLDATYYVKSTQYITKDKAAKDLQEDLGEDFVHFLGYNPLLASINVRLKADYANPDSIRKIEHHFMNYPQVKEVYYQKTLVNLINENVRKISLVILIFSSLLFIISAGLINNTIRLSVYSKRFLINTMQLVGATRQFIRSPYLITSVLQGFIGSFISLGLLSGIIFFAQKELNEVISFRDYNILLILYIFVVILGVTITTVSTYLAVNKYLSIKVDKLYY
ncbi:MAG: permease-like cell division protein FtsX [Bacteroidia bacterium]|nr:permease-like cell division protein FtsX [Bacteroidia bacterium]